MLTNETTSKLHEMHLGAMAEAFTVQMNDSQYNGLSFEDRFSMLVDAEWTRRKSNRLHSLIRAAGYAAPSACVEDISYAAQRQLDKAQILRLASCAYIEQAHNVVILGATGTGKTYLACALGIAANRNYYSTKYIRLRDHVATPAGIEPATSGVTGRRANHLRYGAMWHRAKDLNIDCLSQSQACCQLHQPGIWCARRDLNSHALAGPRF